MTTLYLTSDFVGVQWLRSLSAAFPSNTDIATDLSSPWSTEDLDSQWRGQDFLTIVTVSGNEDNYSPQHNPVYSIDCWSRPKTQGSNPPWNRANQLAEAVRQSIFTMDQSIHLVMPGSYPNVRISDVSMESTIRRVPNDPLGLAHYVFEASLVFNEEN